MSDFIHEPSYAKGFLLGKSFCEKIALDALKKIASGESQFDNVDHMHTAREALEKIDAAESYNTASEAGGVNAKEEKIHG